MTGHRYIPRMYRHDSSPRFRDSPPDILRRPSVRPVRQRCVASAAVPFPSPAVWRCVEKLLMAGRASIITIIVVNPAGSLRLIIARFPILSRKIQKFLVFCFLAPFRSGSWEKRGRQSQALFMSGEISANLDNFPFPSLRRATA